MSKSPIFHHQTIVFTHEETETHEGGGHGYDPSNRVTSNLSKGHPFTSQNSPDRATGGLHKLESRFFKNPIIKEDGSL
jgi:hypothetical protein